MISKKIVIIASLFIFFIIGLIQAEDLFPTPDILKDNVVFWKKVYSELTLNDGLIHDRDYPAIIYEKIIGNANTPYVKKRKEYYISLINHINTQPDSTWSPEEKAIVEQFRQHASIDALSDAAERVRFQLGQADRFQEGLIRSGQYLDTIRSILRQYGVPERLAYLPHVESSFNTAASSKVGAAGLWQFMRSTGKLFGMKIDYTIDERRDPVIATRSAARYLSSAYKDLNAWPLAITSYNHGINGMKRAVYATGSHDIGYIIQNYESKSFKFASTNFYSCFLAASEIAENYKTYFPNLTLKQRTNFVDYNLDHFVSPDVLCKYLNITKDQLVILNPAIRPAVFDQKKRLPKGFKIHIPSSIPADVAMSAMSKIPDSLKSNEPDRPKYYKINRGDNLVSIASRLSVSVQDLASENNLTRKSHLIAGRLLRIPNVTIPEKPVESVTLAEISPVTPDRSVETIIKEPTSSTNNTTELTKNDSSQKKVADMPHEKPIKQNATNHQITKTTTPVIPQPSTAVAAEAVADSLKGIATAPAVETKDQKANGRPSVANDFDVSLYNLDASISPVGTNAKITVSIDETISHYAEWLGISPSRIRKLNNMGKGSNIKINRPLLIPIETKDMLDQFVEARLEYHMAIEEDFYSQYVISDVKPHIIKKNENLWDICNESDNDNGLPLWLFKKYNKDLDLNKIAPGITVWIPVVTEAGESETKAEGSGQSSGGRVGKKNH